jgi:GNAT superfamily N-acetyltransferase
MVIIRKARKSDEKGIMEVCYKTGYMGEPITYQFLDKKLFGYLFCLYYPRYEPENCFVAEDDGKIVGYILGSPNTKRQDRMFLAKIGWRILFRVLFVTSWHYSKDIKLFIHFARLPRSDPHLGVDTKYPAHLHIDILDNYQRKGIGSRLMKKFEDRMRKLGVRGIHLGTSEGNFKAVPFYKKWGYEIIHIDEIGMWPDAPKKRGLLFAKELTKSSDDS